MKENSRRTPERSTSSQEQVIYKATREKAPDPVLLVDVLQLVGQGYSDKDVAQQLYCGERTVTRYKGMWREATGISGKDSSVKLVLWGLNKGLIDPKKVLEDFSTENFEELTDREWEILQVMGKEKTSSKEEVSKQLTITEGRVQRKIVEINDKLGTNSGHHAIAVYRSAQIVLKEDELYFSGRKELSNYVEEKLSEEMNEQS